MNNLQPRASTDQLIPVSDEEVAKSNLFLPSFSLAYPNLFSSLKGSSHEVGSYRKVLATKIKMIEL
jgi:hypothetical protein